MATSSPYPTKAERPYLSLFLATAQYLSNKEKRGDGGHGRAATRANTSHLRTSHGKFHLERIKQVDKIEKLILRIKGRRWRHLALLRFVLVVDLLDLPTIDAQAAWGQDVLGHLVPQADQQRASGLLGLQGESQIDHLRQCKEPFAKTEAIRIQFALYRRLRQEDAQGIMGQVDPVEFLVHSFGRLGAEDFPLGSLVRFDLI